MYSPKWHDIYPPPQCYGWNGATHWGSLGRPSNPQPLVDSRQAEISVVLQSFKKKKKQKRGTYCQMSLQEALFYSARTLRVSPEHISNLIAGACQWFYLVLFILPVLARRCCPWGHALVRSLSKQEAGLFFKKKINWVH